MVGDEAPSCNNNDDSNNNNSADKSRARSAEDERRRWQLVDDSRDVKLQRNNQSRGQSSRHSQLGAARSLESAPPPSSEQVEPPAKGQLEPSKEEESKQMFSLKQLAINSRNLARRRPPGQEQSRGTFARLFRESGSQSSSQSSADSSNSVEAPNVRPRRASAPNNHASESPTCARCEGLAADTSHDKLLGHQDEEEDDDEEVEDEEDDDEEDDERKLGGRRQRRRQVNRCCNCEQLVSRIDLDGLPVTDVDLVSYRDLCQMEQQARLASRQPAASMLLGRTCDVMRRRSLQEESGAYYQLCTSGQEQLIRQRYAWFPPSLKLMQLVEQFFQHFPAQKIPLQPEGAGEQPAYRDQQIAFQLPRQDISLDYCGYHMSEQSRLAYLQFVDKRNSQALDVGSVVQLRLQFGASNSQADAPAPVVELQHQRAQRKASTVSQAALALAVHHNNQKQQQQQPPQDQLLANGGHAGTQRCRRCLVRFEDTQLAIVAPNFVIGSTALFRPAPLDNQPADRQRRASNSSQPPSDKSLGPGQQQPTNAAMFHPTCFTCSTCKEFLVDMVYCLRDNKLYCLRHYGDSLRPRCHWCQELIFSDEYLKAMNESFHVDHFLCRHCDSNLAGQRYVLKDEKPFCIQCYEANFANTCEDCQKPIGIDSRDLSYQGRHWHDNCFLCNKCQQSLIDKPFSSKTDKVYCADCYDVTFAARCDGCNNPLRAGSKKMEYRGKQWHDTCFCCCVCQLAIGSNSFIPKNDDIYCIKCYEDKYATRCTKCKQVIVSGGVTFRNEPWHRDCFNCCNCNKSLAGQRFTTRDVSNETVMNTNKTNQPHNAYCIDCYGELFAKKCFACSQAITGLGGTRFVTFEDRSWHNDCFLCNDCNTSLVGKGFITDGPESILCGECARAKFR